MPNSIDPNEQNKLNALLAEFSRRAGECDSSIEVFNAFDSMLSKLIDYDQLVIRANDSDSGDLVENFVGGEDRIIDDSLLNQLLTSPASAVPISSEPVLISDFTDPTALDRLPFLNQSTSQPGSLALVPLKRRNETVGSILVLGREIEAFSSRDVEKLQIAAAHIAPSVVRLSQLNQLEKKVAERTVLAEIGLKVSSTIDFQLIWDDFAETVKTLLPCDRLVMHITDESSETGKDKYVWGVPLPNWDELPARPNFTTPFRPILETKTAQIVSIEDSDAISLEMMGYRISEKTGLHSNMIAPLVAGNQVVGTLNIRARASNAYTDEHLKLFGLLATQIAGSVAASELYSRSLRHAEEVAAKGELELKNKRLVENDAARSRFIASITHELRTPMTSIVAATDLLTSNLKDSSDEKSAKYLDMIGRNTKRLYELIENLLDLSDIEDDELGFSVSKFTLYGAVKDAQAAISPIAESRSQRLVTEFPGVDTVVNSDRERLVQILKNMLSNACKYSPDHKEIKLKVSVVDGQVEIVVIDHGMGISEDDIPLIFDEFGRLDNDVTKSTTGQGLGLPISRKLARAMGGDITVTSEVGSGSIFTLTLPITLAEAA